MIRLSDLATQTGKSRQTMFNYFMAVYGGREGLSIPQTKGAILLTEAEAKRILAYDAGRWGRDAVTVKDIAKQTGAKPNTVHAWFQAVYGTKAALSLPQGDHNSRLIFTPVEADRLIRYAKASRPSFHLMKEAAGLPLGPPFPDFMVYRCFNLVDDLIYIGSTKNLPGRFSDHVRKTPWWSEVHRVTLDSCETLAAARRHEKHLIKTLGPLYNVMHNNGVTKTWIPYVPAGGIEFPDGTVIKPLTLAAAA